MINMANHKPTKETEIEGAWITREHLGESSCSQCGALRAEVPKQGHPNSFYWALQRTQNEVLVYCPNGCLEYPQEREE